MKRTIRAGGIGPVALSGTAVFGILLVAAARTPADESPTGPARPASTVTTNAPARAERLVPRRGERPAPPAADATVAEIDGFVERLIAEMTLVEKIGQMRQAFPPGPPLTPDFRDQIRRGELGSIFYAGDEQQVRQAQRIAVEESRLGVPLIVGRDVIHGFRTVAPIPLGQAATWNEELVEQAAAVAAHESRRAGIHWTFAPMVDVARDPRWGRIAEGLGEDPVVASRLGAAMVRGLQQPDGGTLADGIAACPKHFVAYGLAEGGRDYNSVMVSRSELRNVFLQPFQACIDAGAVTLMSAFNTVNGVPATGHKRLLRGVLKHEWGFHGFVVSDWGSVAEMTVHGFTADDRGAAEAAVRAGVDMEMSSDCFADHLETLTTSGAVDEDRLNESVARILRAKVRLGLFTQPYAAADKPALLNERHRRIAQQAALESLVLLKNERRTLPLDGTKLKRVAVVGPLAEAPLDQLGTWTLDGRAEDSVTPLAALKSSLGPGVEVVHVPCTASKYGPSDAEIAAAAEAARTADVVIALVGEEAALSGEAHCRTTLDLPGSQRELIEALTATDAPVVMVVLSGRPLAIGRECDVVDAVLYAWHPGTMGGAAIAEVLLGAESPSGKLPISFPKSVGQVPLYYNHLATGRPAAPGYRPPTLAAVADLDNDTRYRSHYVDSDPFPLFPFGYGMSYTEFAYDGLELSRPSIAAGQTLAVRARVTNVGDRPGTEVVQLYVRDVAASIARPVRELKDFRRLTLAPGESQVVEFALSGPQLGFFNEDEQFLIEPGEFRLGVGGDSRVELSANIQLVPGGKGE
ncbi:MAG: glycoside hydrolase family 3 C-terminal domain-containing protein [Pirellulales bacterium]|nr:glycoside hydrolase family 3 C-terminal domain-containing protein [Pirellulales bacterium]